MVEQPNGVVPGRAPESIEVRHLRYFLAVVRARSFTRAAETLFVGQPALSTAVRQLEAGVGERLLVRGGGQLDLTAAGQAFCRSAKEVLDALDRAVVRAREAARPSPTLRLFSPYETNDTARAILREMRARHPDVTVDRVHGGSRAAVEALLAGRVDAVVGGAFDLPDGVAAEVVRRERLVAVVPADHDLATADTVTLAELAARPVYLPAPGASPTWTGFVRRTFAQAGITFRAVGGDSSGPTVFADVVAAGAAVAVTVESDDLGPGVAVRPIRDAPAYPWSVLWSAADPAATVPWVLDAARRVSTRSGWLVTTGHASRA